MAELEIQVLGGFHTKRSGLDLNDFESNKVRALLAYLVVESNRPHRREELAGLLWPERSEQAARRCLSQALSNLRTTISDRQVSPAYLIINRQTIQFNIESMFSLDVAGFAAALQGCPRLCHRLPDLCLVEPCPIQEALSLYRGNFLSGFSVPDSAGFEEWVILTRENLKRRATDAIQCQVSCLERRGKLNEALHLAYRWLELDPWWEEAHRQVMRLLALRGQRSEAMAHYESLCNLLIEELGVKPEPKTILLFNQIMQSSLSQPVALPAFLSSTSSGNIPEYRFIARKPELEQLDNHLSATVKGTARVVFITGTAGQGKTALLQEFARRAQARHPALVVASGNCNAYTGGGDPFLPFREVLAMLAGDVETQWMAGAISQDHARRLWALLPIITKALVESGPDLVDILIPGEPLITRATTSALVDVELVTRLEALVKNRPYDSAMGSLPQHDLLTQYTNVLIHLSRLQPLLLLLDDLQWADGGSLNLLFHLGRRLKQHKVFLVGAYRPEETGAQATFLDSQRRLSLDSIADELHCHFGVQPISLDQTGNRDFLETFLDDEPSLLGGKFRQSLYQLTEGHPLFTIELVRAMQQRGDLIQDQRGRWTEADVIDWQTLPVRVEAALASRLGSLPKNLRDILSVASIEGETFTAEVVAGVLGVENSAVIRLLSRELDRRYRLVKAKKIHRNNGRRLSVYHFRHILFQKHVYSHLDRIERAYLHEKVGLELEAFFDVKQGEPTSIIGQLARHFESSGIEDKAIYYLIQAGDWARRLYSHQEAADLYQRALVILKKGRDFELTARTLLKLGLAYHKTFNYDESRQAYQEGCDLYYRERISGVNLKISPAPHPFRIVSAAPSTLDFTRGLDEGMGRLITQLFCGLVSLTPSLNVVPDLAQSWDVTEGGRRYIFHLRDDIFWSDGVPVSAGDFVFSWRRFLDPAAGSSLPRLLFDIKGAKEFNNSLETDPETIGVHDQDDHTLVVDLEKPTSFFPQLLANHVTFPLPRHIVSIKPNTWTDPANLVTNGPFKLDQRSGEGLRLSHYPEYHGQIRGNVQRAELLFADPGSWAQTFERYASDNLDAIHFPVFLLADMETILQRFEGDMLPAALLGSTQFISFAASRPPFDDVRVRRAFALGTDKKTLADAVLRGSVQPATRGLVPFGISGVDEGLSLPYDLARARKLFAEAGYPDGRGFPPVEALTITIQAKIIEFLHNHWQQNLGVDIRLNPVPVSELTLRLNSNRPDLVLSGWQPTYPDPDNLLRVVVGRYSSWQNEQYYDLIQKARSIADQASRLALYQKAEQILVEEAPLIPLNYSRKQMLVKPWVKNWSHHWKDIDIEPH